MNKFIIQLRLYIGELCLGWAFNIAADLWSDESLIIYEKLIDQMRKEFKCQP